MLSKSPPYEFDVLGVIFNNQNAERLDHLELFPAQVTKGNSNISAFLRVAGTEKISAILGEEPI
jgi:hypothetical protein